MTIRTCSACTKHRSNEYKGSNRTTICYMFYSFFYCELLSVFISRSAYKCLNTKEPKSQGWVFVSL